MKSKSIGLATVFLVVCVTVPLTVRAENFSCTPDEVKEFDDRIHVRCVNSHTPTGYDHEVRFIAIGKGRVPRANRFASMATTALTCGLTFRVEIPASPDDNISGCRADDCRTPTAFGVRRQ